MEDVKQFLDDFLIVVGGIAWFVRWLFKRRKEAEEKASKANSNAIESISLLTKQVSEEEYKILWRYSAMRMYIIHFTNGTSTEAGLHLWKVSFHHEVLQDYYVEPIAKHYKIEMTMPEMFLDPMNKVMDTGKFFLNDVEGTKRIAELKFEELKNLKDPKTIEVQHQIEYYNWLMGYKIKTVLWIGLRKQNGKISSVLVIHWPAAKAISEYDIPKIMDMKKSIEQIYNTKPI